MRTLPSSDFRKTYASLKEPVVVTVKGHVIGTWTPARTPEEVIDEWTKEILKGAGDVIYRPEPQGKVSQKQRDEWLRKMQK